MGCLAASPNPGDPQLPHRFYLGAAQLTTRSAKNYKFINSIFDTKWTSEIPIATVVLWYLCLTPIRGWFSGWKLEVGWTRLKFKSRVSLRRNTHNTNHTWWDLSFSPDIDAMSPLQIVLFCDWAILPDRSDGLSYLHLRNTKTDSALASTRLKLDTLKPCAIWVCWSTPPYQPDGVAIEFDSQLGSNF